METSHREPVSSAHPLVKRLYGAMRDQGVSTARLAVASGVDRATIKGWGETNRPLLHNLEACLNALGISLVAVPPPRLALGRRPTRIDQGLTDRIVGIVCNRRRVARAMLFSKSRSAPVARARQEAMWLMARLKAGSLSATGRHFGRDHTTVIHAVRTVDRRMGDDAYRADLALMYALAKGPPGLMATNQLPRREGGAVPCAAGLTTHVPLRLPGGGAAAARPFSLGDDRP